MQVNGLSGKSAIFRIEMNQDRNKFSELVTKITEAGGNIVGMDASSTRPNYLIRDLTVNVDDTKSVDVIAESIKEIEGVRLIPYFRPHLFVASGR